MQISQPNQLQETKKLQFLNILENTDIACSFKINFWFCWGD